MKRKIDAFLNIVRKRDGHQAEFMQAVEEVAETVIPYIIENDIYHGKNILMRMCEPERAVAFRVCLLYTSPSPRDQVVSRMPSSA